MNRLNTQEGTIMKLTIESMMYGPDGLAHAEDGKAEVAWK